LVWTALKVLLCLVLLIAAAVAALRWLARRGLSVPAGDMIRVVAVRPVAPGKSVQVIQVAGKQYLIGVTDQITVLAELPDAVDPGRAPAHVPDEPFAKALDTALAKARQAYRKMVPVSQEVPVDGRGEAGQG
jgi:flagellar protein FliO/FliZ